MYDNCLQQSIPHAFILFRVHSNNKYYNYYVKTYLLTWEHSLLFFIFHDNAQCTRFFDRTKKICYHYWSAACCGDIMRLVCTNYFYTCIDIITFLSTDWGHSMLIIFIIKSHAVKSLKKPILLLKLLARVQMLVTDLGLWYPGQLG